MKRWFKSLWALGLLCTVAVAIAAVPGIFTTVNATTGYLLNGSGGMAGQALCSDGTYYDTPCGVGGFFYQTIYLAGSAQTQRSQLNFTSRFTAADSSSPSRTTIDVNGPGTGNYVATETADPSSSVQPAYYDGNKNIVPHVPTYLNCLSVSCAGGSTYVSGTSYFNSTGHMLIEEVNMSGPGGGGTGDVYQLSTSIGGAPGPAAAITNSTDGTVGVTFFVPTGNAFSATVAKTSGGGGAPTLSNWIEIQ